MSTETPEPAQVYLQLRERILTLDPAEVGYHSSPVLPHVWGVVMETGYPVGYATLVALADGTTSLYYSTGGGMLGSGEYTPIAESSRALIAEAEFHLEQIPPTSDFQLPQVGQVRIILLTFTGIHGEAVPEKTLATGEHPLSTLFTRARETMEQLRLLAEKKRTAHHQ
jgi:hypothetical protein